MADKGMSIVIHTQELINSSGRETVADLIMMHKQRVAVCISTRLPASALEEEINKVISTPVPEAPPAPKGEGIKSWSKTLRNLMFVLFQKSGEPSMSFDDFYARRMKILVEEISKEIDEVVPDFSEINMVPGGDDSSFLAGAFDQQQEQEDLLSHLGITEHAKKMFSVDESKKMVSCFNHDLNEKNSSIIRDMVKLGYNIQYGIA
jgi:hypothetical protein